MSGGSTPARRRPRAWASPSYADAGRSRCTTCPRACTPASVRPAQVDPQVRQPQHGRQGALELGLHGAQAGLDGPAGEVGAVVAQVEAQTDEPAVPGVGVGGLGSVVRRRSDASGRALLRLLGLVGGVLGDLGEGLGLAGRLVRLRVLGALGGLGRLVRRGAGLGSSLLGALDVALGGVVSGLRRSGLGRLRSRGRLGRVVGAPSARQPSSRAPSWRSSWWPPRPPGRSRPWRSAPRPAR